MRVVSGCGCIMEVVMRHRRRIVVLMVVVGRSRGNEAMRGDRRHARLERAQISHVFLSLYKRAENARARTPPPAFRLDALDQRLHTEFFRLRSLKHKF